MGQPEPTSLKPLRVVTQDEATDVTVLDGRLRTVATGRGALETKLPPGVYKVIARTGDAQHEDLAVLDNEGQIIRVPLLSFRSPMPLENTSNVSDAVRAAATEWCGKNPKPIVANGQSSLFLFIFDMLPLENGQALPDSLGRDVTLCSADGKEIVDVATVAAANSRSRCLGATLLLDPGLYRLRIRLPAGDSLERVIVTVSGWQTRVFLQCSAHADGRRPNLADGAVALRNGINAAFDPRDEEARLTELARISLAQRRPVLSNNVFRRIALGEFSDPMVGLYGVHLLLLAYPPRGRNLAAVNDYLRRLQGPGVSFATIIDHLRSMLRPNKHPDVEALALLLREVPRHPYIFRHPTMLRDSWLLVCNATARAPEIVPPNSVSSTVALSVVNQQPWLVWMNQCGDAEKNRKELTEAYREVLEERLPKIGLEKIPQELRRSDADPGSFPDAMSNLDPVGFPSFYLTEYVESQYREQLTRILGLPVSSIERLIRDLVEQSPDRTRHYVARISLEAERVLGAPAVEIEPSRDGVVHLRPRQRFDVRIRSRKAGVVTVALLSPGNGIVLPRQGGSQFEVEARKESVYPSLQGPANEKALLLVTVTAKPLADALRKELGHGIAHFPDESALFERLDQAIKSTGQEWVMIGTVILIPDVVR
jgi:hypothetical protein